MSSQKEIFDLQYSLLLIGDSNVGKTSVLTKYVNGGFNANFDSTIGIDFKIKSVQMNGKNIKLRIWDTAGQEKFRTITNSYYRGAHGVIVCYSIIDRDSFHAVRNWLNQVEQFGNDSVIVSLIGCKCDLGPRAVSFEEGERLATENNCSFHEVSGKSGSNVDVVFDEMLDQLHKITLLQETRDTLKSTVERDQFLQSAYEVRISGAKSWYNRNKINGRYVPQVTKDGHILLELGRFCYWNIDSPNTKMIYKDNHWVIKKNRKELAKIASSSIQCFPDTASLKNDWYENRGVYFTWLYPQPEIKCVVLNTSTDNSRIISVADIFDSSATTRGTINMGMFIQYSKEPEQMGLTIPLFVKCCQIRIAILDLEYASLKKSYDYVTMGEIKIQKAEIDKTCKALMSTVSLPEQPRIGRSRTSIMASLKLFLKELDAHYETLCNLETGNFESARRCKQTQGDLVLSMEKLVNFTPGPDASRLSMMVLEGMDEISQMELSGEHNNLSAGSRASAEEEEVCGDSGGGNGASGERDENGVGGDGGDRVPFSNSGRHTISGSCVSGGSSGGSMKGGGDPELLPPVPIKAQVSQRHSDSTIEV